VRQWVIRGISSAFGSVFLALVHFRTLVTLRRVRVRVRVRVELELRLGLVRVRIRV